MKLKNSAPAAAPAPAEPISEPADDAGFGDFGGDEGGAPAPEPSNNKPFDDIKFDAGVDADEETDPKRFIQQLTGKLGESLRAYTKQQGQPDFDLEKFAINSLLSATHTSEMDEEDRNDIIKKVNTAGNDDENDENDDNNDSDNQDDSNDDFGDSGESDNEFSDDFGGDENSDEEDLQELSIYEGEMGNLFLEKAKKNNMFQEGSNDILDEMKPCEANYKQYGMKDDEGRQVPNCVSIKEGNLNELNKSTYNNAAAAAMGKGDSSLALNFLSHSNEMGIGDTESTLPNASSNNYMFWQNLKTIAHASSEILKMDYNNVDTLIENGHAWAVDHIATSADDIEEVYHFLEATMEYDDSLDYDGETEGGYEDEYGSVETVNMNEAKYHGKKVKLGKPSKGDVKKFKVYVQNKKGNVVKVNFGDKKMEIKRDNPKNKKSFRARHKCSQAKDRTTPKYWSCRMWSSTPVSKIVAEDLNVNEKNSNFDKNYLKMRIKETFNHENAEPMLEPQVKPAPTVVPAPDKVQPNIAPSRKNKPFLPMPEVTPDPKAKK